MIKAKLLGEQRERESPQGKGKEIDAVYQRYDLGCFVPIEIQVESQLLPSLNHHIIHQRYREEYHGLGRASAISRQARFGSKLFGVACVHNFASLTVL